MKLKHNQINFQVDTVDELLTLVGELNDVCIVAEENRGGTFIYRGTGVNNSGTIFNGWHRQYEGAVNVMWFGAVERGVNQTYDSSSAILSALNTQEEVCGGNGTFNMFTDITASALTTVKLSNINLYLSDSYDSQATLSITGALSALKITDVNLYGGRSTYKIGEEKWIQFATENGEISIQPTFSRVFDFDLTIADAESKVLFDNFNIYDCHAESAIRVRSFGTVLINNSEYKNCSNKTFNVYHTDSLGVENKGKTIVSNVIAEDVGILPDNYYADGVSRLFSDYYAFPQGSFNFVVTYGDFSISNAYIKNYGSCAVTADRNNNFNGNNITVECDSANAVTNNPSGAIWDEGCVSFNLSNTSVNITKRNAKDKDSDSSLLQLYTAFDSSVVATRNITNVTLRASEGFDCTKYIVRGSFSNKTILNIDNLTVYDTRGLSLNFDHLPSERLGSLNISNSKISNAYVDSSNSGSLVAAGFKYTNISNVVSNGRLILSPGGNPGMTGTQTSINVSNSKFYDYRQPSNISLDKFTLSGCQFDSLFLTRTPAGADRYIAGDVILSGCNIGDTTNILKYGSDFNVVVTGCKINGQLLTLNSSASNNTGKVFISNSYFKRGVRVFNMGSLSMTSCELDRNIQIDNILYTTINDNFIKSYSAEPVIHLTNSSYRLVKLQNNTLLIENGVVGGSYVVAPTLSGNYQVSDLNNFKKNFTI